MRIPSDEDRDGSMPIRTMKGGRTIIVFLLAFTIACLAARARTTTEQDKTAGEYLNAQEGVAYVGDEACQECHESQYKDFKKTGMGRSLSIPGPGNWPEFIKPVTLFKKKLNRTYTVSVIVGKMYQAESKRDTNGKPEYSEKHEIAFTVGSGDVGRSYLVTKGDALFLSPISYYSGIRGWDLSPGYEAGQFRGFTRPAGDLCVFCHSDFRNPSLARETGIRTRPSAYCPWVVKGATAQGKSMSANAGKTLRCEAPLTFPSSIQLDCRNRFAMTFAISATLVETRRSCDLARPTWISVLGRRLET